MHSQHGLLCFGLHCHRLAWLLHGEPDRSGIRCITLVADVERFNKSGLDEPDLVTLLTQLTRPMVRTATSLHANETRRTMAKNARKFARLIDLLTISPVSLST